jgi:hypothetical protein
MSKYVPHLTNAYLRGHNRNPDQIPAKESRYSVASAGGISRDHTSRVFDIATGSSHRIANFTAFVTDGGISPSAPNEQETEVFPVPARLFGSSTLI